MIGPIPTGSLASAEISATISDTRYAGGRVKERRIFQKRA